MKFIDLEPGQRFNWKSDLQYPYDQARTKINDWEVGYSWDPGKAFGLGTDRRLDEVTVALKLPTKFPPWRRRCSHGSFTAPGLCRSERSLHVGAALNVIGYDPRNHERGRKGPLPTPIFCDNSASCLEDWIGRSTL